MRKLLALPFAFATCLLLGPAMALAATNGPLAYVSGGKVFLQSPAGGAPTPLPGNLTAEAVSASWNGSQLAVILSDTSRVALAPVAGGAPRVLRFKGLAIKSVDISPNGKTLALTGSHAGPNSSMGDDFAYLSRSDGKKLHRLGTRTRFAYDLRFLPDGRSLVYIGDSAGGSRTGCPAIRRIRLSGRHDTLLRRGAVPICPRQISLSPLGTSLAMTTDTGVDVPAGANEPPSVYALSLSPKATPKLLSHPADSAAFSPDGTQIAFDGFGVDPGTPSAPGTVPGYPGVGPHGLLRVAAAGGPLTKIAEQRVSSLTWLPAPSRGGAGHA